MSGLELGGGNGDLPTLRVAVDTAVEALYPSRQLPAELQGEGVVGGGLRRGGHRHPELMLRILLRPDGIKN